MAKQVGVAIIGGGIAGANVAYVLAREGVVLAVDLSAALTALHNDPRSPEPTASAPGIVTRDNASR